MEKLDYPIKGEFILGSHAGEDLRSLDVFKDLLKKSLVSGHNVLIVAENASCSYEAARLTEVCINIFKRSPLLVHSLLYKNKNAITPSGYKSPFFKGMFQILDELSISFPQSLQILCECLPKSDSQDSAWKLRPLCTPELQNGKSFSSDWANKQFNFVLEKVYKGKFNEGLKRFKPLIYAEASDMSLREERIVIRIKEFLENNPHISYISGFWGSAHTGITHILNDVGIRTKAVFCDKENGNYYYDPFNALVRKVRFRRNVSALEWEQALLGTVLHDFFIDTEIKQPSQTTDQKICHMTQELFSYLATEEAVNSFKKRLFKRKFSPDHWLDTLSRFIDQK